MTREEAKEILTHNWTRVDNPNYSESELDEAVDMAIEALQFVEHFDLLKEFQSLQEVVRCKDCKHRDEKCGMGERRWCKVIKMSTVPNDFCSYGERKGGDTE